MPKAGSAWYRAVIGEDQGTPVPFFLEIPATGDDVQIANGSDRIHAKLVSPLPRFAAAFEMFHTKIEARVVPGGAVDGAWKSESKSWGKVSLSFHAVPVDSPDPLTRFPNTPGGPDPSGVWKVALTKPGELGKLTVSRDPTGALSATFAFQSGNLAFVAGTADRSMVRMSAFDGSSPYLLVFELDPAGKTFKGSWAAGQALDWKEHLEGTKTDDFVLELQTKLAAARPTLNLPVLANPPYRDHPVIVELSGSWCTVCGNAIPMLRELQTKYAAAGLQILTLDYEFTDDTEYNKRASEQYAAKYHIPWTVLAIDGGLEKYNTILPPELDSIDASGFPLALFVARDRGIEGFHTGFPPEAWGKLHDEAVADYSRLATKIAAAPK